MKKIILFGCVLIVIGAIVGTIMGAIIGELTGNGIRQMLHSAGSFSVDPEVTEFYNYIETFNNDPDLNKEEMYRKIVNVVIFGVDGKTKSNKIIIATRLMKINDKRRVLLSSFKENILKEILHKTRNIPINPRLTFRKSAYKPNEMIISQADDALLYDLDGFKSIYNDESWTKVTINLEEDRNNSLFISLLVKYCLFVYPNVEWLIFTTKNRENIAEMIQNLPSRRTTAENVDDHGITTIRLQFKFTKWIQP